MTRRWLAITLLALAACGGDGVTPPPVVPPDPPVVALPSDPQALLTDEQLRSPALPDAPEADARYAAWASAATYPVRSLTSDTFSDLDAFLPPLLEGRRVVALGESSHLASEFDTAKLRLIKYLHERLGYDVLAFESSLYACWQANRQVATLDARTLMRSCIFGVWQVDEVLPLFEYLRATQQTARPLVLAGFDNQPSGALDFTRWQFLRDVAGRLDTAFARRASAVDSEFTARLTAPGTVYESLSLALQSDSARYLAAYDSLAAFLDANRVPLAAQLGPDGAAAVTVAAASARSGAAMVRATVAPPSGRTSYEVRDSAMASNLDVLLDQLYPGRKVIVWAHNAHIQRDGPNVVREPASGIPVFRNMGWWVAQRRGAEWYGLGLYMLRGSVGTNTGNTLAVRPPPAGSLESILARARRRYLFLDLSRLARTADSEWLFQRASAYYWGYWPEQEVLHDQYDGVLFIDTVKPATFLP